MGTDSIFVVYGATWEMYHVLRESIEMGDFEELQTSPTRTYDLRAKGNENDDDYQLYYPAYQRHGFAVKEPTSVYLLVMWSDLGSYDGIPLDPCLHIHSGIRHKHAQEHVPYSYFYTW